MEYHRALGHLPYARAVLTTAWTEYRKDLVGELFSSAAAPVAIVIADYCRSRELDYFSLLAALLACALSPPLKFVVKLIAAPRVMHNSTASELERYRTARSFAELLRQRLQEIESLQIGAHTQVDPERVRNQLHATQRQVISLLRSDQSTWKHQPDGWDKSGIPELHAWGALSAVLTERHGPGAVRKHEELYDEQAKDGVSRISPTQLLAECFHAKQVVVALIEEVEHPDRAFAAEHPEAFSRTVGQFSINRT